MDLSNELVPIISRQSIEKIATEFLEKYCPEALEKPIEVPIEDIVELGMGLEIDYVNIERDCGILGMMIFSDGYVELYDGLEGKNTISFYKKGSLLVESALCEDINRGRERFTITHEAIHWYLHQLRFMILSYKDGNASKAFRCPAEKVYIPRNADEWIEWQADNIAAAVLMPKEPFKLKAKELIDMYTSIYGFEGELLKTCVIDTLADKFQVSKQAAGIRLEALKILGDRVIV